MTDEEAIAHLAAWLCGVNGLLDLDMDTDQWILDGSPRDLADVIWKLGWRPPVANDEAGWLIEPADFGERVDD